MPGTLPLDTTDPAHRCRRCDHHPPDVDRHPGCYCPCHLPIACHRIDRDVSRLHGQVRALDEILSYLPQRWVPTDDPDELDRHADLHARIRHAATLVGRGVDYLSGARTLPENQLLQRYPRYEDHLGPPEVDDPDDLPYGHDGLL